MDRYALSAGALAAGLLATSPVLAADAAQRSANATVYRAISVDGLNIFYQEAGPKDGPTLLLLHGFPSSSRMFEPLFRLLSGRYHLIAPDYPGFGHSDAPPPERFAHTFDHLAQVTDHFTEALGLARYVLYVQDYGGPIGFRLALAHPERVQALIVQNAVAHNEGLGPLWAARRAFWADRASNEAKLRETFLSPDATRLRHVASAGGADAAGLSLKLESSGLELLSSRLALQTKETRRARCPQLRRLLSLVSASSSM